MVRTRDRYRQDLPPDLDAFARGDDDAIFRRHRSERLDDPRPSILIPGVKNQDARDIYVFRMQNMQTAIDENNEGELGIGLGEAYLLGLHRAGSVMSQEILHTVVLGLDAKHAIDLRNAALFDLGLRELSDKQIAIWMRLEAHLMHGGAKVSMRGGKLRIESEINDAFVREMVSASRSIAPLATPAGVHEAEEVVDRPKGLPPLRKVIERMQRDDDLRNDDDE